MNEQSQQLKNTPLHIAARYGHYLIVKYLVENGANPNITNKEGLTPLNMLEEYRKQVTSLQQKKKSARPSSATSVSGKNKLLSNLGLALKDQVDDTRIHENIEGIRNLLAVSGQAM